MSEQDVPRKIRSIWPPLVLLALSLGYVAWAQRYGATPRLMPTIVGGATAVLCLLDLLSRLDGSLGRAIRAGVGADFANREMTHDPSFGREVALVGWMVAAIVGIIVLGLLPTIPLFVACYMRFWGHRPWRGALISAAAVLAFVVIVFEVLLAYELYRGLLEPVWPW